MPFLMTMPALKNKWSRFRPMLRFPSRMWSRTSRMSSRAVCWPPSNSQNCSHLLAKTLFLLHSTRRVDFTASKFNLVCPCVIIVTMVAQDFGSAINKCMARWSSLNFSPVCKTSCTISSN
uniref:Uncharacterized protein n=1 Tax=Physcomitrium patens TaxID=3218 RepID=A0A2K1IXE1_PHYPA|nr:hypothetical protein PHYPA_023766 [Physcomitrium patens]